MEIVLHPILLVSSLFAFIFVVTNGPNAQASPADPDRPIPKILEKISYKEITTSSSSVARGFSERNLFKMKAWRPWGSLPHERVGAWIKFSWQKPRYLDTIHYVPGDERAPGYFDNMCSRPAKMEVQGDFETRTIDLEDVRGHQYIVFDPPLITQNLKFTIKKVRGKSKQGGVCFAAISFYSHENPIETVPKLKKNTQEALKLLQKPLMRTVALNKLSTLGPVVSPLILDKVAQTTGDRQRMYLESAAELLNKSELGALKMLKSKISRENIAVYIRARASIGDPTAVQELIQRVDDLKPSEQADVLLSVVRSKDPKQLGFLLSKYGIHPEVDEVLKTYLTDYKGVYKKTKELYKVSKGRKKAAFLELLARISPQKALPLLQKALSRRDDAMQQSGAIRGAAYSDDQGLRMRVRKLSSSVYVVVRRAVAFALSEWALVEDASILKELAGDKAMSVRKEALTALGRLPGQERFLKSYALYGSDEGTAEAAAKSWMSGKARLTINAPLELLSSPFESVRQKAILAVTDHQGEACPQLIREVLHVEPIYPEHIAVLNELWKECKGQFVNTAKASSISSRLRALQLTRKLKKPEMLGLVASFASTDEPELQVSVAKTSKLLSAKEAEKLIGPYLKNEMVTTRCAAIKALAHFQSRQSLPLIEKGIKSGLEDPYQADRAWLLCTLDAAGKYKKGELAPLLGKAYKSWSRSLGFVSYRLKVIEALSQQESSPSRMETLMKASTDIDKKVRNIALEALKSR